LTFDDIEYKNKDSILWYINTLFLFYQVRKKNKLKNSNNNKKPPLHSSVTSFLIFKG